MRILIVKLSSIGDIVHALPAAAVIKKHLPEATLGWAVEERFAEIIEGNPHVDMLIRLDTRSLRGGKVIDEIFLDIARQSKVLRRGEWEIAIDLQGLLKSAAIARISGAKKRWGFSKSGLREPAARVLYTDTAKLPERQNIIEKNLGLVRAALGFDAAEVPLDHGITPSEGDIREAKAAVESFGGPFVLLNPAGGWVTKLWHAEKYGQLADRIAEELGLVPVISAGPGDAELVERAVAASASGKLKTIELPLKAFYETARYAEAYIGGDTGPTHIVAAAGTPIVGIFGPTEWWRNGTLNPDDICVERTDIGCRVDCHRRTCGNWICMDISVDTVFTELRRRLATRSG